MIRLDLPVQLTAASTAGVLVPICLISSLKLVWRWFPAGSQLSPAPPCDGAVQ